MKKPVKIILLVFVVLVCAVVAVPFFVPLDNIKAPLIARIEQQTGRKLTIGGNMKATLFPTLGIQLEKVALSNPEGFADSNFLEADNVVVKLKLLPLLHKSFEIESFVLNKPRIALEVDKQGRANWVLAHAKAEAQTDKTPQHASATSFNVADVEITDGSVSYQNQQTAQVYHVEHINLNAEYAKGGVMQVQSGFSLNKESFKLTLQMSSLQDFLQKKQSPMEWKLESALLNGTFKGKASLHAAEGEAYFASDSLVKLAAVMQQPIAAPTPLLFKIKGTFACTVTECSIQKGNYLLDALQTSGDVKIIFAGNVPVIQAELTADKLDFSPYASNSKMPAKTSMMFAPANAAEFEGWSTTPFDFSALGAVNANVSLKAQDIVFKELGVGPIEVQSKINGGVLQASVPAFGLYGGSGKANVKLDANANPPTLQLQSSMEKVQVQPLLKALMKEDRLSGTAKLVIDVSAQGANERQMIASLHGQGNALLRDGSIRGVNYVQVVRDVKSLLNPTQAEAQNTDFSELSASFQIHSGVVENNDLNLKAPLLRMRGKGTIDLAQWSIAYRLYPQLVGSLQGQGGKEKQGLEVPVIVEGNLAHPNIRPDVQGAVQEILEDPQAAKEKLKNVKEQLKENKGSLKELKKEFKDPQKIQNLLQGLGR